MTDAAAARTVDGANGAMDAPALTVPGLLDARSSATPASCPFLVDGTPSWTYAEWNAASRVVARNIARSGCYPGMRIGLLFDGLDWLNYAIAYIAVLRAGCTAVHLSLHLGEAEIRQRVEECGVSTMIMSRESPTGFDVPGRRQYVEDLHEPSVDADDVPVSIYPDLIADIRYTSGTTGRAKPYLVSHANLTFGKTLKNMEELSSSSSMLVPMPIGTSTSATILAIALTSTSTLVLCSPLDIERMGQLIEAEKIRSVMITPFIASQIVEARLAERYDLSAVTIVATASSHLPAVLASALLVQFPRARLQIACAQSEASPALFTHVYNPEFPFSIGKPTPDTELRIADEEGRDVARGELGEIWLRTPAPKRFFLHRHDLNALLLKSGWYRTGDMGAFNIRGEVEFFDRRQDAIRVQEKWISSLALEAAILENAQVREAAVVRSHGPKDGRIIAYVVLRDPAALPEVKKELQLRLQERGCAPDHFVSLHFLPRNHSGKVLKRDLRLGGMRGRA